MDPADPFLLSHAYSREHIASVLGGNYQHYLPRAQGRITHGAFRTDTNPDAPHVVLTGTGPDIVDAASLLEHQGGTIPVFVRRAASAWIYLGPRRLVRVDTDPRVVHEHAVAADRVGEVSSVLWFEPPDAPVGVRLWLHDDDGYEAWRAANQNGFIGNVNRGLTGTYFKVHHASHKLSDRSHAETRNPRTGNKYAKVTAATLDDLLAWGRAHGFDPKPDTLCDADPCARLLGTPSVPTADADRLDTETGALLDRGWVTRPAGVERPEPVPGSALRIARCAHVRAWVLARAGSRCELCGERAPFVDRAGRPFLEVHHMLRLADGGPDIPKNTAAVCPNCHRALHHAADRDDRTARLALVVREAERMTGTTIVVPPSNRGG